MNLKSYLSLGAASVAVLASAGAASASTLTIAEGTNISITLGGVQVSADPLFVDGNNDGVADGPAIPNTSVINRVEFINAPGSAAPGTVAPANTFAQGFVSATNIPEIGFANPAFVQSFDFNDVDLFDVDEPADLDFAGGVANTFTVSPDFGPFIKLEIPPADPNPDSIDDLIVVLERITTFQSTPLDDPIGADFTPTVAGDGKLFTDSGEFVADVSIAGTFPTTGGPTSEQGAIVLTVTASPEAVPEPASLLGLFSVVGLAGLAKAKSRK